MGADVAHTSLDSYGTHVHRLHTAGAIANAVSYAVAIGAGTAFVETVRAARRRKQGRCVWCGYDCRCLVPGSLCPECGASRTKAEQR